MFVILKTLKEILVQQRLHEFINQVFKFGKKKKKFKRFFYFFFERKSLRD